MIAVDTSAVMAVLLGEDLSDDVIQALSDHDLCMSAGTLSELLIVASARNVLEEANDLITSLGIEIVTVDGAGAHRVQNAFMEWGKGRHPASLNFGDCFAYALANERDIPLLYVGSDFLKTDLEGALQSRARE